MSDHEISPQSLEGSPPRHLTATTPRPRAPYPPATHPTKKRKLDSDLQESTAQSMSDDRSRFSVRNATTAGNPTQHFSFRDARVAPQAPLQPILPGDSISRLPEYSGKKGDSTFREFAENFLREAQGMGLTPDRMVKVFPLRLRGEARAVFDNMAVRDKNTWEKLLTHFGAFFAMTPTAASKAYGALKQRKAESVCEFARRVQVTTHSAYPSDPKRGAFTDDQRKERALRAFVSGLHRSIAFVLANVDFNDLSWEKALDMAVRAEEFADQDPPEDETHAMIAALSAQIGQLTTESRESRFRDANRSPPNDRFRSQSQRRVSFAPDPQGYRNTRDQSRNRRGSLEPRSASRAME
ncbi:hypothetical protein L596_005735 [Steinernema carpocapsae]|uniref:Retrotransposon gag domain-containing protein n=1 Tax=Steinernema carpocapsae TaxID=34508 RepID=A0A4U8V1E6_STECR|nr:hypothetical protein L596_005735 [Steinernema carpocapsae]